MNNYKIIADKEKLIHFIDWLPELGIHEKYYLTLFARKKYCPDLPISDGQLKRFTSSKERMLEKICQLEIPLGRYSLKGQSIPQEALALYITVNPRCMEKATRSLGKKCWDLIATESYNLHSQAMSCIQTSKSDTRFVIFDIDTKSELEKKWFDTELGSESYEIIKTRGGYHLFVKADLATHFRVNNNKDKKWFQLINKTYPIDQKGDFLSPVVGTFQGGFVPQFHKFNT